MQFSHEAVTIKGRMTTNRNILTIVFVIGAVLLIATAVTGSFTASAFIWLLALLVSGLYILQAGNFQMDPNKDILKFLSAIMYSFVVIWGLAFITSIGGSMDGAEVLGVFLALFATYLMYQFRMDAKGIIFLQQQAKPQVPQPTGPSQTPTAKLNICPNCGTAAVSKFCPNCGEDLI